MSIASLEGYEYVGVMTSLDQVGALHGAVYTGYAQSSQRNPIALARVVTLEI